MIGLRTLLTLPVVVGPWALQSASTAPIVLDGSTLLPFGIVVVLIVAVFTAGIEFRKLRESIEKFPKMERRITRVEQMLDLPPLKDDE